MIGRAIWAKKVDFNTKKWKRPPKSLKNEMFIFGLHSTSDDWPSNLSKKWWPKQKKQKRSLSHWKIKCLFLDYVQLLIIGWAIWAKNIDQDAKKWKRPPKSSKNEMFIFGLRSTSDDRLRNPSKKCWPKHKKTKKGPLRHQKIKCLFLDYIQLLMIGWAIRAKNVNQDTKKQKRPPKSSKNQMFIFGLRSTSDDRQSDLSKKCWPKHKKGPPKSLKNKMFIFGLCSTSDDQPSNPRKKGWPRCKKTKKAP